MFYEDKTLSEHFHNLFKENFVLLTAYKTNTNVDCTSICTYLEKKKRNNNNNNKLYSRQNRISTEKNTFILLKIKYIVIVFEFNLILNINLSHKFVFGPFQHPNLISPLFTSSICYKLNRIWANTAKDYTFWLWLCNIGCVHWTYVKNICIWVQIFL